MYKKQHGKTHTQGKSDLSRDFHGDISKGTIISEDEPSERSKSDESEILLLEDISNDSAITTIKVRTTNKHIARKSANF
jgi:hypothetical protein